MPHLQYTALDGKPTRLAIVRMLTTIGSSRDSDLVIDSPDVAPAHATLTHEPGRYRLESTARANPFFVNGKKTRSLDLRHGDVFVIGDVELTFSTVDEVPQKASSSQPESALQLAQAGFVHELPWGLDTRIGEQGLALSGGQRQRLALARAVLARETRDSAGVQVVVVVVRDQHEIDARQLVERHAGRRVAADPDPSPEGARAVPPVGIGQEVHAVELDQERRKRLDQILRRAGLLQEALAPGAKE